MVGSARPVKHVLFQCSAAGSVNRAFAQLGRDEQAVWIADPLCLGPINPISRAERCAWNQTYLGWEGADADCGAGDAERWAEATSPDILPVAWVHRRCAAELAGFLEFVARLKGAPCKIVDTTDVETIYKNGEREASRSAGVLSVSQMIERGFLDHQADLIAQDRHRFECDWAVLREENAPLRVVTDDGLKSAPLDYFDPLIKSCLTDEWQTCARVVVESEMTGPFCQADTYVLWPRLIAMAESGAIEHRCDISDMHASFVRLRQI